MHLLNPKKEAAKEWSKAEAKIEAHIKSLNPKMPFKEIKSERFSKNLPKFRAYVGFDPNGGKESRFFLLNQEAAITELVDEHWQIKVNITGGSTTRLPALNKFLVAQKLPIKTEADAIEFAKFFEGLEKAPQYAKSLNSNTKDFSGFDKLFEESEYNTKDWKISSQKREGGWTVGYSWVGDLAVSIIVPDAYQIDVDESDNFKDIKKVSGLERLMQK